MEAFVARDHIAWRVVGDWNGLGLRGHRSSPMRFNGVVPAEHRLGIGQDEEPIMPKDLMPLLILTDGTAYMGIAAGAYALARWEGDTRFPSGARRLDSPINQRRIAAVSAPIDAARALLHAAAAIADASRAASLLPSIQAKVVCAEAAVRVTQDLMTMFGGSAFAARLPFERYFRDARAGIVMGMANDQAYEMVGTRLFPKPSSTDMRTCHTAKMCKGGYPMVWNLTAEFIETCSCNMLCPCWYGVRELMVMDQGWCASTWLLRVQHGNSDGVILGGRALAIALDFPGPTLYDGNGTARLYLDDAASADQRRELEAIFQGTKGGPMAIVGGLVTKWLPTQTAQIDIQEQNGTLTAVVAGFGQVTSQRLTNEAGQPTTMQNTGFTTALEFDNQAAQLAPSYGTQWSDPDMPRQFETKSGAVATLTWSVS